MATADQVKALIQSHADLDDTRFYAIAMQVAAQAARNGHTKFSQELRKLIDQVREQRTAESLSRQQKPIPITQPRGELAGILTAAYPKTRLSDMALDEKVQARIERILLEQRQRGRLKEHGFSPLRKLLFVGPPGTGKTMTAAALASELQLPLFTIQFDGLITKYLGETAAKLRLIFDTAQQTRAVYFFDEFDALGGERAAGNDVGEMRRALNSFLQFLEQDESESLIIAATNHPKLLDHALFRRFETVLEYHLPSPQVARQILEARLTLFDRKQLDWARVVEATEGLSHAEIARACEYVAKNAILTDTNRVDTGDLVAALQDRHAHRS